MIGTMNLAMAVGAVHPDFEASTSRARSTIVIIKEVSDMPATALGPDICMALLAKLRALLVQQRLVVRTMDPMTQRTVFAGWRMLPQERAAFFRVTGVTVFINTELL